MRLRVIVPRNHPHIVPTYIGPQSELLPHSVRPRVGIHFGTLYLPVAGLEREGRFQLIRRAISPAGARRADFEDCTSLERAREGQQLICAARTESRRVGGGFVQYVWDNEIVREVTGPVTPERDREIRAEIALQYGPLVKVVYDPFKNEELSVRSAGGGYELYAFDERPSDDLVFWSTFGSFVPEESSGTIVAVDSTTHPAWTYLCGVLEPEQCFTVVYQGELRRVEWGSDCGEGFTDLQHAAG